MAQDRDDRDRQRPQEWRGWDDNRSYGARTGEFPSQYSGMGGSGTENFANRGVARMSGWRPDWDPQDQDRYDHSRSRWQGQGAGGAAPRGPHPDDEAYRQWRRRQIEALDRDYADYCRHRQDRLGAEFDDWRRNRGGAGSTSASHSGSEAGGTGPGAERR